LALSQKTIDIFYIARDNMSSILKTMQVETVLGPMVAISDEESLYLLEFVDWKGLGREIDKLSIKTKSTIIPGVTEVIKSIESELKEYFAGRLKIFKTPMKLIGSDFQKDAWNALIKIPYGKTRSYAEQANFIGKPLAHRAVANANGVNKMAIIIPCHRIINSNGKLGGYGGGIARKKWLIELEKKHS